MNYWLAHHHEKIGNNIIKYRNKYKKTEPGKKPGFIFRNTAGVFQ